MKIGDRYICDSTSGGGTQSPEGEWIIKSATAKSMTLEKLSDGGVLENYEKGAVLVVKNGGKHPIRIWGDGSFTVYVNQTGIPYHFTKAEGGDK